MSPWRLVFDFGGVLVDWNPQAVLARFYRDPELAHRMLEALYRHPDWQDFDGGVLDEARLRARVAARSARPPEEIGALLQATRESLQPLPDSWRLLERCRARGLSCYGLSNMPESTWRWLQRADIAWHRLDGVLISGMERLRKPEPAIFDLAIRRFGLTPSRTVFIDDLPINIDAAIACGLQGVVFRDAADCARRLAAITGISMGETD